MHNHDKWGPNDEEDVWFDVIDDADNYEDCSGAFPNDSTGPGAYRYNLSSPPARPAHDVA